MLTRLSLDESRASLLVYDDGMIRIKIIWVLHVHHSLAGEKKLEASVHRSECESLGGGRHRFDPPARDRSAMSPMPDAALS